MISRVLVNTGVKLRAGGVMSKSVAQSEILYGSEIWVVVRGILKVLEGFHYWMARRITGMTTTRGAGGEWEYPPVVTATEATGIHPIREYIMRQKATIVENLDCRPIYELYDELERMPGKIRMVRWLDQDVVNKPGE